MSSDKDELLQLAALREQEELQTEQLCTWLIQISSTYRQYLATQESRLQQLKQHLPNDADEVRAEVDAIYKDVAERLRSLADTISEP